MEAGGPQFVNVNERNTNTTDGKHGLLWNCGRCASRSSRYPSPGFLQVFHIWIYMVDETAHMHCIVHVGGLW